MCHDLQESGGAADEGEMERAILREFARCLEQIIENATQTAALKQH